MDNLTPEQRRKNMQNIRSVDTKMEIKIRSELHKLGYRFRKNVKSLPGKPDIVFPKYKTVIFLDSCFWHMCPNHFTLPQNNIDYWRKKLYRNKQRDKEVNNKLRLSKWKVTRIWEHSYKKNINSVIKRILNILEESK